MIMQRQVKKGQDGIVNGVEVNVHGIPTWRRAHMPTVPERIWTWGAVRGNPERSDPYAGSTDAADSHSRWARNHSTVLRNPDSNVSRGVQDKWLWILLASMA